MVGIYQIVNPNGERYVGKSGNIPARFSQHKLNCSNNKLKQSFLTYGIENHSFEVIKLCSLSELDILEFDIITEFREKYVLFNASDYEANAGRKQKYTSPTKLKRIPIIAENAIDELLKPFLNTKSK